MDDLNEAHSGFIQESYRLVLAQNYFLTAAVVGHEGNAKIAERHKKFDEQVAPDYKDGYTYLTAQLFVTYISSFEVFLQRVVSCVVAKNPRKLGSIQFRLADILDSDKEELIAKAIDEHLNKLMYRKPLEYLSDLCDLLSIDRTELDDLWPVYVEAKARRDLGVHAAWRCNATYLRKTAEAGVTSTLKLGESAVPDDDDYIGPLTDRLDDLADRIVEMVKKKHDE